jgi:hypothetical protein
MLGYTLTTAHMNLAIFTLFLTFEDWKPPKSIFLISHFGDISITSEKGSKHVHSTF